MAQWKEGGIVGVPADNGKRPIGIFVRYDGTGTVPNMALPPDQWHTIDFGNPAIWGSGSMAPDLPVDTKAVFLSGLAIQTHPGGTGTYDLWANFRAPGDDLPATSYQIQTIVSLPGDGIRSNAAVWIPVIDLKTEFYWHFTPGGLAMLNLSLQAYVR